MIHCVPIGAVHVFEKLLHGGYGVDGVEQFGFVDFQQREVLEISALDVAQYFVDGLKQPQCLSCRLAVVDERDADVALRLWLSGIRLQLPDDGGQIFQASLNVDFLYGLDLLFAA